jgi:hypothetical protein
LPNNSYDAAYARASACVKGLFISRSQLVQNTILLFAAFSFKSRSSIGKRAHCAEKEL